MKLKTLTSGIGLCAVAIGIWSVAGQAQGPGAEAAFESDGVLVQFRGDATPGDRGGRTRSCQRGRAKRSSSPPAAAPTAKGDLELLRIPPGLAVAAAVRALRRGTRPSSSPSRTGSTRTARPRTIRTTRTARCGACTATPPRPANQYGSQAGEAWAAGHTGIRPRSTSASSTRASMCTHPDLAANVWTNPFDPVDGVDNDGNGYVDDVHGWDFDGNNNTIYDGTHGRSRHARRRHHRRAWAATASASPASTGTSR